MNQPLRPAAGRRRALALVAALALPIGLGGCSSTLSSMPTELGGMPANTPQPSGAPVAYPAVHDMPPPRQNAVLTDAEQKAAEAELAALRERQAKQVATPAKN
ncbi:MAG TPA: hypothetical protein VH249_26505 [Xanthobacteraceae bacterium]|nr:hypothetical protein [Xanthobacteraceae bacterium]